MVHGNPPTKQKISLESILQHSATPVYFSHHIQRSQLCMESSIDWYSSADNSAAELTFARCSFHHLAPAVW